MTNTEVQTASSCSFCLKSDDEVDKLVAGPGVFICNECVDLCCHVMGDPPPMPAGMISWGEDLDLAEVLASLPRIPAVGTQVERNFTRFVLRARALGATWADIDASLGVTRQSAWERFSGAE